MGYVLARPDKCWVSLERITRGRILETEITWALHMMRQMVAPRNPPSMYCKLAHITTSWFNIAWGTTCVICEGTEEYRHVCDGGRINGCSGQRWRWVARERKLCAFSTMKLHHFMVFMTSDCLGYIFSIHPWILRFLPRWWTRNSPLVVLPTRRLQGTKDIRGPTERCQA